MRKFLSPLFLLFFLSIHLAAQNIDSNKANTLFSEGKYSAAQSLYQQIIRNNPSDENAHYYNARCSKELFASDAIFLYNQFLLNFPFTAFKNDVNTDLALLYYRGSDYSNAITYFLQLDNLDDDYYLIFKLAYANFSIDALADAEYYFSKLLNTESKYSTTAQYYSAYIAYENGFYKTALDGFKELIIDEQFGTIVPYYICQIYFSQQSYEQLITFASPLIESVIPSRKAEVNRLLAEAYYRTGDYKNAIVYFNAYIDQEDNLNSVVYFLLGRSYFKINEYENAINYLEKVNSTLDSIVQYSTYYLAASYLKLKEYNYALQAFKKSATYTYDLILQEDAFYNYAKLSYQLDLPFDNTLEIFKLYLDKYDNVIHQKEIEALMIQTFQGSSKYDEAFQVLKDIYLPNNEQRKVLQQLAFFLGVQKYNKMLYKQAISYFQLAAQHPINSDITYVNNFWLADCYYKLGDFEKSAELYFDLSTNSKLNLLAYDKLRKYNLGYVLFQQGEYKLANSYFRQYEKLVTDSMRLNDVYLRIADCFFMDQQYSLSESYYSKAIDYSLFDVDYAIYKQSVALGLIGKNSLKIKLLTKLTTNFLSSTYYDNALRDLARYYKNSSKNNLAIAYYDKLLVATQDISFIAEAHLSKGIIYFNSNKVNEAIEEFLFVVTNFQQTIYFKEALSGLQSAYMNLAKVDKYLEIINGLPEISISKAEQDSLTYNTAFMKFSEGDYVVANAAFDQYLRSFEEGIFKIDATYYNAISNIRLGDTAAAILLYTTLIEVSNTDYRHSAVSFLARKYYEVGDFLNSNTYYKTLVKIASNNSLKREAIIRLMYGNEKINTELAFQYALEVVDLDKMDDWLMSRAKIIIARYEFESGNYAKSKYTFEEVAQLSAYDEGAEAKYYLAYLTYLDDSLVLAEKMIFDLAENYSNDYFIAKAFILLADIYVIQKNDFQAKATLESIIENHKGEGLVNLARKKWELIVEREVLKNKIKEESQSYIEILEQEIGYDLEEVVIDVNYKVLAPDTVNDTKKDTIDVNYEYIDTDEIE